MDRSPPRWRLNGAQHELIEQAPLARRRRFEWRRKRDAALLGLAELRGACLLLRPMRGAIGELATALRELAPAARAARLCLRRGAPLPQRAERRAESRALLNLDAAAPARERPLPRYTEPKLLRRAAVDAFARDAWLLPEACVALGALRAAAEREGVRIDVVSAFRSTAYQWRLLRTKLARGRTLRELLEVNAPPGHSEHHSGRAVDLGTPGYAPAEVDFETSPAYVWLSRRAADFGFRMSFPRGNPYGIQYEPWHWYFEGWPLVRAEG